MQNSTAFPTYLKNFTSFKFVLHILFFDALLNPLATLSCHLQGHSADLPFAIANLASVQLIFENLKADNPEVPLELSQFIAAAEKAVFSKCKAVRGTAKRT